MLLSITPSNMGINEAITVITMKGFGIATPQLMAAAFLWRGAQIVSLLILGPIFSVKLFKELKLNIKKKNE
jgi:uncharacterized membrane protein YbhN (UPF0104 family)